jgi:hypothetical protein
MRERKLSTAAEPVKPTLRAKQSWIQLEASDPPHEHEKWPGESTIAVQGGQQ